MAIRLTMTAYRDKVLGCWLGKNIGGTLGAPLECRRGVFDLEFYAQALTEPLPNDDLDLQLVWLNAVEQHGRGVNAAMLGEYWLQFIVPNWSEYGAGKNNLRAGLLPPLSGYHNNLNRDSCGAFIRSELWACLAPGHPEIAVRYAYEDAIVDHSHEGVYAEIFCAAIQSSAFVESGTEALLDIGLSYLPESCAVAKCVRMVRQCRRDGVPWMEVRKRILQAFPATFGMLVGYENRTPEQDVPVGRIGYDAPSNIGIMVLGWLYGEGDFGKSLLMAVNCGEDADCTGATLGALMGIMHGAGGIPEKWIQPIGRSIKTVSLNLGDMGMRIPKTVDELTDRVVRLTPFFLGTDLCDVTSGPGYTITMRDAGALKHAPEAVSSFHSHSFVDRTLKRQPFAQTFDFHLFGVTLDYGGDPVVKEGQPRKFRLLIENHIRMQQWLTLKWYLPDGWTVAQGRETALSLEQNHGNIGEARAEFDLVPAGLNQARYDLVLEIRSAGRPSKGLVPITLFVGGTG